MLAKFVPNMSEIHLDQPALTPFQPCTHLSSTWTSTDCGALPSCHCPLMRHAFTTNHRGCRRGVLPRYHPTAFPTLNLLGPGRLRVPFTRLPDQEHLPGTSFSHRTAPPGSGSFHSLAGYLRSANLTSAITARPPPFSAPAVPSGLFNRGCSRYLRFAPQQNTL